MRVSNVLVIIITTWYFDWISRDRLLRRVSSIILNLGATLFWSVSYICHHFSFLYSRVYIKFLIMFVEYQWNLSRSTTLWIIGSEILIWTNIRLPTGCVRMRLRLKHFNTIQCTNLYSSSFLIFQRTWTIRCMRLLFVMSSGLLLIILIVICILHLTNRVPMLNNRVLLTFLLRS